MIKQLEKVTDIPGGESSIDDEIQILKSANLMRRVVDSLDPHPHGAPQLG